MYIRIALSALSLLALSPACRPDDPTATAAALALDDDLEAELLAQSCSGTVLVAEGKACVPHPQWRARPLFDEANRGAGRLDRYCVFEWEGDGVPRPDQYPHADDPDPPAPTAPPRAPWPPCPRSPRCSPRGSSRRVSSITCAPCPPCRRPPIPPRSRWRSR